MNAIEGKAGESDGVFEVLAVAGQPPGVGGVMKNRLLEHFGGPEEVYCSDSGEYFWWRA